MKINTFKLVAGWLGVSLLLALPNPALAHGGGAGMDQFVNGFHFNLNLNLPPGVGAAPIQVKLSNFLGQPILNADVWAAAALNTGGPDAAAPGERSEPPRRALQSTGKPGEYIGAIAFDQPGQWIVNVSFMAFDESQTASFNVEVPVDPAGPVLAAFVAMNAAVIGVGAIVRRKYHAR